MAIYSSLPVQDYQSEEEFLRTEPTRETKRGRSGWASVISLFYQVSLIKLGNIINLTASAN